MVASLTQLLELMSHHGATRVYAKKLAPNDNSKNQVYLGGDFSVLNLIPHGEIYTDADVTAGSVRDRAKAKVSFFWIDASGRHLAPDTNLILYPKYPEVRMSGFLKGCKAAPSPIMTVRDPGRVLFIGITPEGSVLGYATDAASPITAELNARERPALGVFLELPIAPGQSADGKATLLAELRRIYQRQWIPSQKLGAGGIRKAYSARNGGGYTLEAELGITPNGYADPDFMGWEVKQYGVGDFTRYRPSSPVTLMTPEPTGGVYRTDGAEVFLRRFGYPDKSGKPDRLNFGGVYSCVKDFHATTGLKACLTGYDAASGKITDLSGGIVLLSRADEIAASWSFGGMMSHWNRKHAQAAYVPSLFRTPPPEYAYGAHVLLCEETDFLLFLKAFSAGAIYYDPGIKIENASGAKPVIKRRSQFRVDHSNLTALYHRHETHELGA